MWSLKGRLHSVFNMPGLNIIIFWAIWKGIGVLLYMVPALRHFDRNNKDLSKVFDIWIKRYLEISSQIFGKQKIGQQNVRFYFRMIKLHRIEKPCIGYMQIWTVPWAWRTFFGNKNLELNGQLKENVALNFFIWCWERNGLGSLFSKFKILTAIWLMIQY